MRSSNAALEPVSLAELYAKADFISFHLPLTPESKGMVNGQVFAQMKRGVRIIDAARGGIIDETALLAALEIRAGGSRRLGCLHR